MKETDNESMFVLSEGELLDYADYEPSNQMSGYNGLYLH